MKGKLPVKISDMAIILLAFGLTAFSAFAAYVKPEAVSRVLIQGKDGAWIFPLDTEETVSVRGPLGNTVVRIYGNNAWVESSPCENQTCVASGRINSNGHWAACLPNNVFLMIEGTDESGDDIDSIAW